MTRATGRIAAWRWLLILTVLFLCPAAALPAPQLPEDHGRIASGDWEGVETERANVFFTNRSPARKDIEEIKALIDKDLERATLLLRVQPKVKMNVLLYPDSLKIPGYGTFGYLDPQRDIVHINYDDERARNMIYNGGANDYFLGPITQSLALYVNPNPSFLLLRGLAMYVSDYAFSHDLAKAFIKRELEQGDYFQLADINTPSLDASDSERTQMHIEAVLFVRHLIKNYGMGRFMQVFALATPDTLAKALEQVYGKSFTALEADFQAEIAKAREPGAPTPRPWRRGRPRR